MPYQDIKATLTDADLEEIRVAIKSIQEKLPFLITLNVTERRRLFKMGDKRLTFVQSSLNAAQSNQSILPNSFDLDGFANDFRLTTALMEIEMSLNQLSEQVDDTLLAVGSEAMGSSLTVYDYVKTAAKKTPGLKVVAENLRTLFRAMKSRTPKPTAPETPAAAKSMLTDARSIAGES